MSAMSAQPSDAVLNRSVAKLWPHRSHESSALGGLFCRLGLHPWTQLDLRGFIPENKEIRFCRWCSGVKINRLIYEP